MRAVEMIEDGLDEMIFKGTVGCLWLTGEGIEVY